MGTTNYSGQTLNERYQVGKLLGKGGMGAVYQGQHTIIGKKVAIKFLHAEFTGNKEVVKRFYREAQAAAAIGHKNIIDVMDVGVSDAGEPYLVMEYLEGESLSSMLKRTGPIDIAATCGILEPALLALATAHEKGIVHRDLKPENIFLVHLLGEPPTVKLIDFGISKFTQQPGMSKLTQTGSTLGTPSYMSPEQARGDPNIDFRSDLYAMGVIFYEMLTGKLPYRGENYHQLLASVLTQPPIPPAESYSGFPPNAEPLVMKALSRNPEDRPQSALEFLNDIKTLEGFSERQEHLTQFASGITNKSFAGGDLGTETNQESSKNIAPDVFSQMAEQGTPHLWSGTLQKKKRNRMGFIVGGAVVAIAIGVGILLLNTDPDPPPQPVVVPAASATKGPAAGESNRANAAAPQPARDGVKIEVTELPAGAAIFYNNAQVKTNPFQVAKSELLTPLRVEAEGFEPFKYSVIPLEDMVIRAKLTAVEKPAPDPQPEATADAKSKREVRTAQKSRSSRKKQRSTRRDDKPTPKASEAKKSSSSTTKRNTQHLKAGARGTKYGKDFE